MLAALHNDNIGQYFLANTGSVLAINIGPILVEYVVQF